MEIGDWSGKGGRKSNEGEENFPAQWEARRVVDVLQESGPAPGRRE